MKRFLALLLLIVLTNSCQQEYQPRNIDTISIQEFKRDSVSIRAIQAIHGRKIFYADSKGNVVFSKNNGNKWINNSFTSIQVNDTIIPNFRSIAYNGKSIFALSIGNPALLYKIPNDRSLHSELVYKEKHEKVFYDSMKFFDELNGIAMGDPTEDCLSIIKTNDGGNTWTKISCDKLPKVAEGEAAFAASNTNIKVLENTVWIVTGGTKARVFKSVDLGETWEVYNTPIIQGNGPQGIYSVDFADENKGIIIGGDYSKPEENLKNKAITNDGGKTWTLVSDGQNPNYKSCVQYVPNTNGKEVFAVGKTGVSYSNDGGLTWKEVSKEGYYTIQFVDKNIAWLSGNEKIGKLTLN